MSVRIRSLPLRNSLTFLYQSVYSLRTTLVSDYAFPGCPVFTYAFLTDYPIAIWAVHRLGAIVSYVFGLSA